VGVTLLDPTIFVATIVKVKDPTAVGVPDNTPVVELRVNPGGSEVPPVTLHVGTGNPVASKVKL